MKDFVAKLKQFRQRLAESCRCRNLCLNAKPEVVPVRFPVTRLIFQPFAVLTDRFGLLFRLAAVFALPITLLSVLMGFASVCFTGHRDAYFFCSDSQAWYLVYLLIKIFLVSVFVVRWYDSAFLNRAYGWKNLLLPTKRDGIAAALIIACFFLNLTPLLSFYLLYIRDPNPDWVVEVTYFAVVSLGFLVPFVLMRFYVLLNIFLDNGTKVAPGWVWARSRGNNLSIILSLFLIIIVTLFVLLYLQQSVVNLEAEYVNWGGTVMEYVNNLFLLMLVSLIINNSQIQKEYLLGGENGKNASN